MTSTTTSRSDSSATDDAPVVTRLQAITVAVVVGIVALVLGLVALTMPTQVEDARTAPYRQQGEFTYSASAPSDSVYGADGLTTGQSILLDVVGPVTADFTYRLTSDAPGGVRGTASLALSVTLAQGIVRDLPVGRPQDFEGREVTVSGTLPVGEVQRLLDEVQSDDADPVVTAGSTSVELKVDVEIDGELAGQPLQQSFEPALPFTLQGQVLTPAQADGLGEDQTDPFEPSTSDQVEYDARVDNTVPLLVAEPSVGASRLWALVLAALCLAGGAWLSRDLWRGGPGAERSRVMTLYGSRIVEIESISLDEEPVADVASIDVLADLAKKYDSQMMHLESDGVHHYLVWDQGLVYRYRASERADVVDSEDA